MSKVSEKIAYLEGLSDGMGIDSEKEGKLYRGILDVLKSISEELDEQSEEQEALNECIEDIYGELDAMDYVLYGEDDEDEDEDDDEEDDCYEADCPFCGNEVFFDEDMLDDGEELICPKCNNPIPLELPDCAQCGECAGCSDEE